MMTTLCCVDLLQTNFMYKKLVNALELIMSYMLQGNVRIDYGMDVIVS